MDREEPTRIGRPEGSPPPPAGIFDLAEAPELVSRNPAASSVANVVPFPTRKAGGTDVETSELLSYCIAMIRAAKGDEERGKAYWVVRELLTGTGLAEDIESLARALGSPVTTAGC